MSSWPGRGYVTGLESQEVARTKQIGDQKKKKNKTDDFSLWYIFFFFNVGVLLSGKVNTFAKSVQRLFKITRYMYKKVIFDLDVQNNFSGDDHPLAYELSQSH